jgi:hypothetical protein
LQHWNRRLDKDPRGPVVRVVAGTSHDSGVAVAGKRDGIALLGLPTCACRMKRAKAHPRGPSARGMKIVIQVAMAAPR